MPMRNNLCQARVSNSPDSPFWLLFCQNYMRQSHLKNALVHMMVHQMNISAPHVEKLAKLFRTFDKDGNGVLSEKEITLGNMADLNCTNYQVHWQRSSGWYELMNIRTANLIVFQNYQLKFHFCLMHVFSFLLRAWKSWMEALGYQPYSKRTRYGRLWSDWLYW